MKITRWPGQYTELAWKIKTKNRLCRVSLGEGFALDIDLSYSFLQIGWFYIEWHKKGDYPFDDYA